MKTSRIKFPRRVRIHGGECGAVARALHHEAQEDALMTYERMSLTPAAVKRVLIATKERKQMSTKTTLKRIALVAVSALGFGVMTAIAPASAAVTALTAGTSAPARVGVESLTTITPTMASTTSYPYSFVASAKITAAPTGSTLLTETGTASKGVTFKARSGGATISTVAGEVNQVIGGANAKFTASASTARSFSLSFIADVAGTYTILVSTNATGTAFAAGDPSVAVTITTTGAPTSMTLARVGSIVEGAANGAYMTVKLKDANGNATILGQNEALIVTQSQTSTDVRMGIMTAANLDYSVVSAVDSLALGSSNGISGTYYIAFKGQSSIAANATNTVTVTGSGLLPATLTANVGIPVVNTGAVGTIAAGNVTLTDATGYEKTSTSGNLVYNSGTASSHGFTATFAAADAAEAYYIDVDLSGLGAIDYATSVSVAKDATSAKFSIAQALTESTLGINQVVVSFAGTTAVATLNYEEPAAETIAVTTTKSILSATGGSNKFTVQVSDQYSNPVPFTTVSVAVTGRNTVLSTALGVTDANGLISYTLTDKGTTGTKDTVEFSITVAGSPVKDLATITYGTVTVSTVTVSGGSKAETVAGGTITDIDASDDGVDGNAQPIKAVVKDANGNLLAGVPVTFTVDAGAIQKSAAVDYSVVYTNSAGEATTYVLGWVAGKQTITATAGGVSGTDYFTWGQTTPADARVLSGTVNGNILSYKVVDRFGNPVNGAVISLSRTGVGFFGSGKSTDSVTTDKTGTADIAFNGDATVVAELATTTQAYDVAGEIDGEAVTAAVAGTTEGLGDTLAPAGVGKVSLAVTLGTDAAAVAAAAAADAAAEAIDAANAATDAANLAAEAADAATVAAEEARDAADAATAAVEELATQVATLMAALKAQITTLANTVAKIAKKVRA